MSAARRHKKHHHEEHENHERWLVSGFDMMTLLFAVFVVLFAISSTNISKVKLLSQSLQEALSGPVFDGGRAMMQTGATTEDDERQSPEPPLPSLAPVQAVEQAMSKEAQDPAAEARASAQEQESLAELKARIDEAVSQAGLGGKVETALSPRGLEVRLLTDGLFFDSGSATVKAEGTATLDDIGRIIASEHEHPVEVEGHTDDQAIASAQFPSNWQLSGARAGAVVQRLGLDGVDAKRMTLTGYGAERPVASNATPAGRAKNRRVEIVLTRLHAPQPSQGGDAG